MFFWPTEARKVQREILLVTYFKCLKCKLKAALLNKLTRTNVGKKKVLLRLTMLKKTKHKKELPKLSKKTHDKT